MYRLNFRLSTSCEKDILTLCPESCDLYSGHACGGRVLRCLTEKKTEVKAEACRAEIFYFVKMEVRVSSSAPYCACLELCARVIILVIQ